MDDSSGGGGDPDTLTEPYHKDNSYLLVSETGSLRTKLENQDYVEGNTSHGNNNTPDPPIDKNLNNSRKVDKKHCSICTIHGNKKTISRKVWIKKKSGLHGWSTTRVVNYECVYNEKAENV